VGETQDRIVQSITSFALYGFPESHAASFALIAYASAYLKCHYLAVFTAAMLNNQPMGFYHPATLVKDAQRHGLHFRPVDVQRSEWKCGLEGGTVHSGKTGTPLDVPAYNRPGHPRVSPFFAVRLGFNYVRGLRKETGEAIAAARPFSSIADLVRRVPGIRKDELRMLAEIGAFHSLGIDRRAALWEAEKALRPAGPLFEEVEAPEPASPLAPMQAPERMRADFYGTGLTIGPHPMYLYRASLALRGVLPAEELQYVPKGKLVKVAGCVICRQRPGTAKGFMFLSMEDETGIANAIVEPDLFETYREALVQAPYLLIEGVLQNQQGAVSVKLKRAEPLRFPAVEVPSHDFR
jgi:error-prone DNA polymerase